MNILIVDDDALALQVLQHYVGERLGHQSVGVSSGAEGMTLLDRQDFDLLMLGLDLSDCDSFELLTRIRSLLHPMDLPVIGMAEASLNTELKAFDAGVNDFVAKPLEMRLVLARVQNQLRCRTEFLNAKLNAANLRSKHDQDPVPGSVAAPVSGRPAQTTAKPIPCEIPVMLFLEGGSYFCKTLKIGTEQLTLLAFNDIPRANSYQVQLVHPTGETMEIAVAELRRTEIGRGAAGSLSLNFEVRDSTALYEQFCAHLDRAWRHKGLAGLKEVLRGSMSISRAEQAQPRPGGAVPTMVGARYRHQKLLGVGGFATVFLVRDLALQRDVAMKVLSPELAADADARERFLGEARIAAQFHHANIVFVYEVGACPIAEIQSFLDFPPEMVKPFREHFIYFTMQYVEGQTLAEHLRRVRRISPTDALHIFTETLRALAFAHQKGVIHRDIKPGNIMIDNDGHIIVTDFGIARLVEDGFEGAAGSVECTPRYASPEQLLSRALDGRSDIYSLAVTLYEMISGSPPFQDSRIDILVARQLNEQPPELRELVPEVTLELNRIVMRCLAKDPAKRYAKVGELLVDLEILAKTQENNDFVGSGTLTLLLDRVLLVHEPNETREVVEKLIAHLHVHSESPADLNHIRSRITEPAVLDTLLSYGLDDDVFPVIYRFFNELRSNLTLPTLLRWYAKDQEVRISRALAQLILVSASGDMAALAPHALTLRDVSAAHLLRVMREMERYDATFVQQMGQHSGERTRLELLYCIRNLPVRTAALEQIVVSISKNALHPKVRELALKMLRSDAWRQTGSHPVFTPDS